MKKLKALRWLILVFIGIAAIGLLLNNKAQACRSNEGGVAGELVISAPVSEWKIYRNEKWGYSVGYPAGWSPEISMENVGKEEYIIKEEVTFSNQITIAIWTNLSKLNISQWFKKNKQWLAGEDAEITTCTVTALELSAICVREPQTSQAYEDFKCFFQKEDRIYRIRYTNSDKSQSFDIYEHMISTFKFE